MIVGIFSDVHGNFEALKATVADGEKNCVDRWICLGDLFVKGPQPQKTADYIESMIERESITLVKGNTDESIVHGLPDKFTQEERAELSPYVEFARSNLSKSCISWLKELKGSFNIETLSQNFIFCHAGLGGLDIATAPDMKDDVLITTLSGNTELHTASLFYGHIHIPYMRKISDVSIFNVGSVGLPFDLDYRASYMIVEIDDLDGFIKKASFMRVAYDIERLISISKAVELPGIAQYLDIMKLR